MILVPMVRPVLRPLMRPTAVTGLGGVATPSLADQVQALFGKYSAAGGVWDFTDMATLFQDSARTVPVTAAAQPVGVGHRPVSGRRRPAQPQRQGVEGEGRTRHPRWMGAVCGCVGGLGGSRMILLSGMGLLLVGSAVWHEIQVWRGKR